MNIWNIKKSNSSGTSRVAGRRSGAGRRRRRQNERRLLAERLEDRRVLAGEIDYGDAPDAGSGNEAGNYSTLLSDGGASHTIAADLFLGQQVDGDDGSLQSSSALADDHSQLLADLAADFVAGTVAGDPGDSINSDAGTWQYLVSERADPNDAAANLRTMVWDTSGIYEDPTQGNRTDGFNGTVLCCATAPQTNTGTVALHPNPSRSLVARWKAGDIGKSVVTISGSIRNGDIRGGDGVQVLVYVGGVLKFEQTVDGTDGTAYFFSIPGLDIGTGSIIDLVTDSVSGGDFDRIHLGATISLTDDEDGVAGGLRSTHYLPGDTPKIDVNATNQTVSPAVLAGWIDYDRNGVFDNVTERATIDVPAGTSNQTFTLTFPEVPVGAETSTYARFRLSGDATFIADPMPTGHVLGGEVEDYVVGQSNRVWDGEAGDGDWFNPLNWSTVHANGNVVNVNAIPGPFDDVRIPSSFAGQVIAVQSATGQKASVGSLVSDAALRVGGNAKLDIKRNSQIAALEVDPTDISGSHVSFLGNGNRRLVVTGNLTWKGGGISRLQIDVGGNLELVGDGPKFLESSQLDVRGDASLWSGGDVNINGSTLINHGTLTMTSSADFPGPAPFGPVGTLVNMPNAKLIYSPPDAIIDPKILRGTLRNEGVVEVLQGQLRIGLHGGPVTHTGAFRVRGSSELVFDANQRPSFDADSRIITDQNSQLTIAVSSGEFSGALNVAGKLIVDGEFKFTNPITVPSMEFRGGTITTEETITVTGVFDWLGGTIAGGSFHSEGEMTIGDLDSDDLLVVQTTLVNKGDANWISGRLVFTSGKIRNEGTFQDSSEGTMSRGAFTSGVVDNLGIWTIADSVGAATHAIRDADYVNRGTFNTGMSRASFNQLRQINGTLNIGAGSLVEVTGEDLLVRGGEMTGSGTIAANVTQLGGVIRPGSSPGTLTIQGDFNATAGVLAIEIAGPPMDPGGHSTEGSNFDSLIVSGQADIATLNVSVIEPFQPQSTDRYQVVSAENVTGPTGNNAGDSGLGVLVDQGAVIIGVFAVANSQPSAIAGDDITVPEGSQFVLDGSLSSDPDQETQTLTYEWDLDYDGVTFVTDHVGIDWTQSFTNNLSDPVRYALRVTDDEGESDIDEVLVIVTNVAPKFVLDDPTGPPVSIQLDEQRVATMAGSFVEPGDDAHRVSVDWGDGSAIDVLNLSAGARQFSGVHSYAPTSQSTSYEIVVTVTDQDGDSDTFTQTATLDASIGTIGGRKFDDANGNSIQDDGEPGLSGWTVELVDHATGVVLATSVTDQGGDYYFPDVPPGDYIVREIQQEGWRQTYPVAPIRRITTAPDGTQANGQNDEHSISHDGRYIAFSSLADNLIDSDSNGFRDVFVKDTVTGEVDRISLSITGDQANGPSDAPSISADGNVIVFRSFATNLVQGDTNDAGDIFAVDRRTNVTTRINLNLDGAQADRESLVPIISGNGRFIVFSSSATNLVANDTNGVSDIFLYDLFTETVRRASTSLGVQSDGESFQPSISHDGRYVAYVSAATTLDPSDRNAMLDIYVYDSQRESVERVSRTLAGDSANRDSFAPHISGDGSSVAFSSRATNLVPGDTNGQIDVFVADFHLGRINRITSGNGPSTGASLSHDGQTIAFVSIATDLVVNDSNDGPDVFVYERALETTTRLAQAVDNPVNHFVISTKLSGDAGTIVFGSDSPSLIDADTNSTRDVFVQELTGVHRVSIEGTDSVSRLNFGNRFRLSSISGQKFLDSNGNGQRDVDPESGAFTEPGLDGWTIRLLNPRTGETWEQVTASIDLDGDGRVDPISERGHYKFSPLPPAEYEVYELLEDGWLPTFPRLTLSPTLDYRLPVTTVPGTVRPGNDPRLFDSQASLPRSPRVRVPVTTIPAAADGQAEQLPILYVKGFNDDGAGWGTTGNYFEKLQDITDGAGVPAGIDAYGIQFWSSDDGDPNLDPNNNATNRTGAVVQTLAQLRDPNNPLRKRSSVEFISDSAASIFEELFDPANWIPTCDVLTDLTTCEIPALTDAFGFDFQMARSSYNENGSAAGHADDLLELLQQQLGQVGPLADVSQVNIMTHSAGGLDTRAMLALLDQSVDPILQDSVSNVIYTAPPFGGSTGAEVTVSFFENERLLETIATPWAIEVLTDHAFGPMESLLRTLIAEPIAASMIQSSGYLSDGEQTAEQRIASLPDNQDILNSIQETIQDLDGLIKNLTAQSPFGSFGLSEILDVSLTSVTDVFVLPLIKQVITAAIGLPGLPKIRDDLRPYEAIHNNIDVYEPNTDVPQFVVWGEGGFLRFLTGLPNQLPSTPVPVNLGPPLDLAASDTRSLHAYGDQDRKDLDFNQLDLQPGDGNLSRTSALFMTDLAGGSMKALAGFTNFTHGTINSDVFTEEANIQGSFLENDGDNVASLGEVLVETFLTPVTSLEITEQTTVVDPDARIYRLSPDAEISFDASDRFFRDLFGRQFGVTASAVEYRVLANPTDDVTWNRVDPDRFQRRASSLAETLNLGDEQPFTLQWRSINQHGSREAIRSAELIVDSGAPSLEYLTIVDSELPGDESQIHFAGRPALNNRFVNDRTQFPTTLNQPTDWYVNLDRGKLIHLEFDSPVTFEYGWNDSNLVSPNTSVQGDPSAGFVDLLIRRRDASTIQLPGIGLTYLSDGPQTLYYRVSDDFGNASAIHSLDVLIDEIAPAFEFSLAEGQVVGPSTPINFSASDVGAGVLQAWVNVPGVGRIASGSGFTLGEGGFSDAIDSGDTVALAAFAQDRVDNSTSEVLSVIYDFAGPTIELQALSDATQMGDGRIITMSPKFNATFSIDDDTAGIDLGSLSWSVGSLGQTFYASGDLHPTDDGKFEVNVSLSSGENQLQISAFDAVGNASNRLITIFKSPGRMISTERGDQISGADFGNVTLGSISGIAFRDDNGNGLFDKGDETILENVRILLDSNGNGQPDPGERINFTNQDGAYRFDNLPARTHDIVALSQTGFELTSPVGGSRAVVLGVSEYRDKNDFGFTFLGGTIGGFVFQDANANGRVDGNDKPLSGVRVSLGIGANNQKGDFVTVTDQDGRFAFTGLGAGDYTAFATVASGYRLTTDVFQTITIAEGEINAKSEFGVFEVATIQGSVFEDGDRDGMRDPNERRLSGFELKVDFGNDGTIDDVLTTTATGFQIDDAPHGQHRIKAVLRPGFIPSGDDQSLEFVVSVSTGTNVMNLDFAVSDRREQVNGMKFHDLNGNSARDPGEPGIEGWTIYADVDEDGVLDGDEPRTVTDPDGNYSLLLPEGQYIIREVQRTGWRQTVPKNFGFEQVSDSLSLKADPTLAGANVAWTQLESSEATIQRFDGQVVDEIFRWSDGLVGDFSVDADGTVVWTYDSDGDNDREDSEVFRTFGTGALQLTQNQVEDRYVINDAGQIAWQSGTNLFANDGSPTIVVSQEAGIPFADGGSVAFFGRMVGQDELAIHLYDGQTIREIPGSAGHSPAVIDVHGQNIVWANSEADGISNWFYDGQTTTMIAPPGQGGDIRVDRLGNVVWFQPNADGATWEVMLREGMSVRQLTFDGLEKLDLGFDEGIAVWSSRAGAGASVSIFDGREIIQPDFELAYGPTVDAGRVAFVGSMTSSLNDGQIYLADVRDFYPIDVRFGNTISQIDFGNQADQPVLLGTVFRDIDGDGLRDSNENFIDAIEVQLLSLPERALIKTAMTRTNGSFEFVVQAGQEYLVMPIVADGDEFSVPTNGSYSVMPSSGEVIENLRFGITRSTSNDNDGVPAQIEDAAPNDGDGNADGIRDSEQSNVTSLPNAVDSTYVTIVAPVGTELVSVTATSTSPDPAGTPKNASFPVGFINYEIHGIGIGETVDVTLIMHNSANLTKYFKYGPTPGEPEPHFYQFNRHRDHGLQSFSNGRVTLRFTDGLTGDDDLTANGIIVDPSAPAIQDAGPATNPLDRGDVNLDGKVSPIDALLVINYLARNQSSGVTDASFLATSLFLDPNEDEDVSPSDALTVINLIAVQMLF